MRALTALRLGAAPTAALLYGVLLAGLLYTLIGRFDAVSATLGAASLASAGTAAEGGALLREIRSDLVRGCVGVCAVASAGALVIGLLLGRGATRLAAAVESSDERFGARLEKRSNEFRRLEAAVGSIPERTARLRADGRRAAAIVAHDLRTPVAKVRMALDAALASRPGDVDGQDALPRALARCDELADLLHALLRISEIDGGGSVSRTDQDLVEMAGFMAEAYGPAIVDGGRSLRLVGGGAVRASVDRTLILQAVANLLDNAQIHTPPGTSIEIGVDRVGSHGRIWISDDGPGVPAADRRLLTEPFFRTDRGRSVEGHGLGMSTVAAVCAAHRGRLAVTGRAGGDGLRVELLIPMAAASKTGPLLASPPRS